MSSSVLFTGPGGRDPVKVIIDLQESLHPTAGDGLFGGQMVRTFIRDDAAHGVDVDGNPLTPYSDAYAKQKTKRGRNASPPDLFGFQQHDHMLNGILVKSGGQELDGIAGASTDPQYATEPIQEFRVGIYSEELAARARYNNEGTSRMPVRTVFGINEDKRQKVESAIGQRCEMRARTVLRG